MTPGEKERALVRFLQGYNSSIVAFSGGVDSSYLAFMANRVMGPAARIVTALSPSVSRMQRELAGRFAADFQLNHRFIDTAELENPSYAENPVNRCYFCKSELFDLLGRLKAEWGVEAVFDGSNADDKGDYRPGREAAEERSVTSPLIEVGMTKAEIRERSRRWKLPTWNLPAMPCLASRLPYGVSVTPEKLSRIERAEDFLRDLGFREFRVRHHEDLARIEVAPAEMTKILDLGLFDRINRGMRSLGYQYVTLDLQGFRSGSLNELLEIES